MKLAPLFAGILWCLAGLLVARPAMGGVVEEANTSLARAFQAEATPPPLAARNLAIVHLAIHDAVNLCLPVYGTFLKHPGVNAATAKSSEIAARLAAHTALVALYPSRQGELNALLPATLKSGDASAELGRRVAQAILESRKDDGSATTIHYVPSEAPGQWRRTPGNRPPEMPHWGKMKLFCLERPDQFRSPAPAGLTSAEYAKDWKEVKDLGGLRSTARSSEQTMLARFWSDFSYTSTPPGHWNEIARDLSVKRKLALHESARLFALLNVALADAGIACWENEYHYNFWRPVTAIQEADKDGNDATVAEKVWEPLLKTPPHPEYGSGHSVFSGAAVAVLDGFFPPKGLTFEVRSDTVKDAVRTFTSFEACAQEIAQSRVWGGIHFPQSCKSGLAMGRSVGTVAVRLLPSMR